MHLSWVTIYQPANRYWPIPTYETLIFFGLALAIGAFTVWWCAGWPERLHTCRRSSSA